MPTLATPANMRAFREANPDRTIQTPDGPVTIMGRRCFAVSVHNPDERASADAGDYFMLPDDRALIDTYGAPMVLALERTAMIDAMTGEPVEDPCTCEDESSEWHDSSCPYYVNDVIA
jgi:hypothetical protein